MEATNLETIKRLERDRSDLLEALARLEGETSSATVIEPAHFFGLLDIVKLTIYKLYP